MEVIRQILWKSFNKKYSTGKAILSFYIQGSELWSCKQSIECIILKSYKNILNYVINNDSYFQSCSYAKIDRIFSPFFANIHPEHLSLSTGI